MTGDSTASSDPLKPRGEAETLDMRAVLHRITSRLPECHKAEQFYEGTRREAWASDKLRRALARSGTDYRLNYARTPVTARLDRLEVTGWASTGDKADTTLEQLDADNMLDQLADEVHEWGLVYGEVFVLAWPMDDGADEGDEDAHDDDEEGPTDSGWLLTLELPTNTCVLYDEEHHHLKRCGGKAWKLPDGRHRVNVYYPDHLERFVEREAKSDLYVPHELEEGDEGRWDYPEDMAGTLPLFHFRTTRKEHGRPVHRDAWGPQSMILKLCATQMAVTDYHGAPIRYLLLGGDDAQGSSAYEDFEDDEETGAEVEGGARTGTHRSGPGELWTLKGSKAGQFDPADPDVFLKPITHYVRAMAATTGTPVHVFEGMVGEVAGEALRAAEQPLTRSVRKLARLFLATWRELSEYVLPLAGAGEGATAEPTFAPFEAHDDADSWTTAAAQHAVKVPLRQVLLERGYTGEQLDSWGLTEETLGAGTSGTLGPAEWARLAQQLYLAVPGLLNAEEARQVLAAAGMPIDASKVPVAPELGPGAG